MSKELQCPNCGGHFEPIVLGAMQDKWLKCPYCQFKVDVPDTFERSNVEETILPDGTRRRVETSERRLDIEGMDGLDSEIFRRHSGIPDDVLDQLRNMKAAKTGCSQEELDAATVVEINGEVKDLKDLNPELKARIDELMARAGLDGRPPEGASGWGKVFVNTSNIIESRSHSKGGRATHLPKDLEAHLSEFAHRHGKTASPGNATAKIITLLTAVVVLLFLILLVLASR